MTYASYLIRPAGWLDDEGEFHYIDETENEGPPRTWTMLYTLHNPVVHQPAAEEDVPADLFGEIPVGHYRVPPCPTAKIIELYHKHLPLCPRVMLKSAPRDAAIRQRWREVCADGKFDTTDGLAFFEAFFLSASGSKFLNGRTMQKDRKPFLADLLWLMRPTNFVKVCEGRYRD